MMRPRSIEELVFHMSTLGRTAGTEWARIFAASIDNQSRRRNWNPSTHQRLMRRLVSEIFSETEELDLIER